MKRLLIFIVLITTLTACPGAPLAWHVNLLDKIEKKTGSFEVELPFTGTEFNVLPFVASNTTGAYKFNSPVATPIEIPFPTLPPIAIPVDYSDQTISVKLTAATISYKLKLAKIGDISGQLRVQAYLTTTDGDISAASSKLGAEIVYDLSKTQEVFVRDVVLSPEQLTAINEKQLKIAFKVAGSLKVITAGDVGVSYELQALSIKNIKLAIDEKLPNKDGEIADFSDADKIPPQVVGLKLDYGIRLEHNGDFAGKVNVQLYLAPVDENDIYQDKYKFGSGQEIDLSKNDQLISGNAAVNQLQLAAARKDQKLKYGLRINGDVGINKGGKIKFDYTIKKLDLTAFFTIL